MNDKIFACLANSTYTGAVCDYAAWAAARLGAGLEFIDVLDHHPERAQKIDLRGNIGLGAHEHLLNDLAAIDQQRATITLERGRLLLEAARQRALDAGLAAPTGRLRHGDLVDTLVELEGEARLFVLGKRGEAGDRAAEHLGANLERVVRGLHRPILVAPPRFSAPSRVMIAFDGSPTSRRCVKLVAANRAAMRHCRRAHLWRRRVFGPRAGPVDRAVGTSVDTALRWTARPSTIELPIADDASLTRLCHKHDETYGLPKVSADRHLHFRSRPGRRFGHPER